MSAKHSKASKARWANVPPDERKRRMSAIATLKQKQMTPEEKVKQAKRLVDARKAKAKLK